MFLAEIGFGVGSQRADIAQAQLVTDLVGGLAHNTEVVGGNTRGIEIHEMVAVVDGRHEQRVADAHSPVLPAIVDVMVVIFVLTVIEVIVILLK